MSSLGLVAHSIVPIAEQHIDGFRSAIDSVARERRYLALLEAPPEADVKKYVRGNIAGRVPHFVAIADGKVVGWCDIALKPRPALRHSGILGMGVLGAREAALRALRLRDRGPVQAAHAGGWRVQGQLADGAPLRLSAAPCINAADRLLYPRRVNATSTTLTTLFRKGWVPR